MVKRMLRKLLAASAAALVLFHAWLFGAQAIGGRLADAGLLGRWAAAGLLVAALWHLRRQGVSLIWGRQATAIWVLAALLHGPAALDRLDSPQLLLPDVAAALVDLGTLVLAAAALAGARRRSGPALVAFRRRAQLHRRDLAACMAAPAAPFAPRPPPVR